MDTTADEDVKLDTLFKRVRARLLRSDARDAEEIRENEHRIAELKEARTRMREAVKAERWYDLGAWLSKGEIEALCETSPTDLLGPGWEE